MNNEELLEIINEAYDYSEKLYSGINTLVKNIEARNLVDLEIYFKNILEGFNWIVDVAVSVTDVHGEKIDLQNIHQMINKYVDGYNNIDFLFVSDVLEYELIPQVEVLYNIFGESLNKLESLK